MKQIRDNKTFEEDGYKSIYEFAEDVYGITRSTASRWMEINDKFSKDGNSPELAAEYKEYGKSQLQEMLYLDNKQLEEVNPDMTVREIKGIRKPEPEKKTSPIQRNCITGKSQYGNCVCCGANGVDCCAQCAEFCNGRCGWCGEIEPPVCDVAQEESEEIISEGDTDQDDSVIEATENVVEPSRNVVEITENVVESTEDGSESTEIVVEKIPEQWNPIFVRDQLEQEEKTLKECFEVEGLPQAVLIKQEALVKGLRLILDEVECEEEEAEEADPDESIAVQPELPVLKNNVQREEFIENYNTWPIWFKVPEASETYYRYNLPDGSSIVICEYKQYVEWKERYVDENPETVYTREYLLKPGYHYLNDCCTNTTTLIERLKEVQKHGR